MRRTTTRSRRAEADDGLERIVTLERRRARTPRKGRLYRTLTAAIRAEAKAYRQSLDVDQAAWRWRPGP